MHVAVENNGGLERRMTVRVPAERIDQEVTSRLQSMKGSIRLDGFRPGKVPLQVVEKKYGAQVRMEVIDQVIHSSLQEALAQENLRPAGEPAIDSRQAHPGEELEYVATFEVFPEFDGALDYSYRVIRPVVEVSDADIEAMLEKLRKQRATGSIVDRKAQREDQVVIDFEGSIDGRTFAGNQGEKVPVVLGSGSMVAGFEDQLIGAAAGDELTVNIPFPADYPSAEVAGREAQFKVKVHSVAEMVLPELDDEFARAFGMGDKGVKGLREEVTRNMHRELKSLVAAHLKDQVFSGLLARNPVEVPRKLITSEAEHLGKQQSNIGLDQAAIEASAERRVKLGILVSEVVKQNNLQIDPDRVREAIETVAASYENPDEVIQHYYGSQEILAGVQSAVMEDQVVDWIIQNAGVEIEDRPMSFDEMVEAAKQSKG